MAVDSLGTVGCRSAPESGAPTFGQEHAFTATAVSAGNSVGSPQLSEGVNPVGPAVAPEVGSPTIVHGFGSAGVSAVPAANTPTLSVGFSAAGISAASTVATAALGQKHALVAPGVKAKARPGVPYPIVT